MKARAVVEPKYSGRHFADLSQWTNCCLLQTEVLGPTVGAWIEKARELSRR